MFKHEVQLHDEYGSKTKKKLKLHVIKQKMKFYKTSITNDHKTLLKA